MKQSICILSFLSIFLLSCQPDVTSQYTYSPPSKSTDGLAVASLQEVNMDSSQVAEGIRHIRSGHYGEIHSLLIWKSGKLVLEEYFPGHEYQWDGPGHYGAWTTWDQHMLHVQQSVSKSITSLCIGIAVEKGYIKDVHQSVFDFLPEYRMYQKEGRELITIEHLLTMTSGLPWDEWHDPLSSIENDAIGIWFHPDGPIHFSLNRPMEHDPGSRFNYNGSNMYMLTEIIRNAAKMNIDSFSSQFLFHPLGIDSFDWWLVHPHGEIDGASGLKLRPRDMIRIGMLCLNNGKWNGQQILPVDWIRKSAESYGNNTRIKIPGEDAGRVGYGYSWWNKTVKIAGKKTPVFWANGWGGQKIIVIPDHQMVVTFTGGNFLSKVREFDILERTILSSIHRP